MTLDHVYAALMLLSSGRAVTAEALQSILEAAGSRCDPAVTEALAHLCRFVGSSQQPRSAGITESAPRSAPLPSPGAEAEARAVPRVTKDASVRGEKGLAPDRASAGSVGCYMYGVAFSSDEVELGVRGINGGVVFTIVGDGLAAIVQDWPEGVAVPEKEEELGAWAQMHLEVLDAARQRFGTVLPVALGRLVGRGVGDHHMVVRQWLRENAAYLRERLQHLAGKAEYGLKVMWDPETVAARLAETSPELRRLKGEMAAAGPGQAYLMQERFSRLLKAELEAVAAQIQKNVLKVIQARAADFRMSQTGREDGQGVLMKVDLLIDQAQLAPLGEELEALQLQMRNEGLKMRLTGPWPPFSFAS